ncbi:hypothetical protein OROGR_008415 [Orobanche gracilis]
MWRSLVKVVVNRWMKVTDRKSRRCICIGLWLGRG